MQIKAKNLSHIFDKKTYRELQVLSGISATFKKGEFVTVIGESGCGKTTFIEHLNGLLRPSEGEVIIGNQVIDSSRKKIKNIKNIRKNVGIVFQFSEYQLFEETIEKDIMFGPLNMGVKKPEAKLLAKKYLNLVGLGDEYLERSPFALSGGQKRRVAIAGILAMEPQCLIFDEPTAGLDPDGQKSMYKIFNRLNKLGKTIIIVTHNLSHVLEHSKRTIVLSEGKLVYDGPSVDAVYDKKMIKKYGLEEPELVKLVWELEKKGLKIGKVKSINELVKKLGV